MGVYDRSIANALRLIQKFGVQCEWRKGHVTPTDPNKPWLGGTPDPAPKQPFICFVPATTANNGFGSTQFTANSEVKDFSTYGLMGAQDFVPDVTDHLTCNAKPMVIKHIDTLAPAGEPVLYILSIE